MLKTKDNVKKLKNYKIKIFSITLVMLILFISLFFNSNINNAFKLIPNTSFINSNLQVHFVDVGQGDAICIRLPNDKTMLIDSGNVKNKSKFIKYLDEVFFKDKEKIFNYVVITHSDLDHIGNTNYIINNYVVENFLRPNILAFGVDKGSSNGLVVNSEEYKNLINNVKLRNINDMIVDSSFNITINENCNIKVLNPINEMQLSDDENDFSLVIKLTYFNNSFLFMGDASSEIENALMMAYSKDDLKCDVLKVGHHGSKNSTSYSFLEFIEAKDFIISSGENNYNLPNVETLERINNYCSANNLDYKNSVKRTDEFGNIIYWYKDNNLTQTNINNINEFLYFDWYKIVIILEIACLIVLIFNILKCFKLFRETYVIK